MAQGGRLKVMGLQVASIVPPKYVEEFEHGQYVMVLASWYTEPGYLEYWAQFREGHPDAWIILDNGAFENAQVPVYDLLAIANDIRPNELVLPDAKRQGDETFNRSLRALKYLFRKDLPEELASFMFVPHGEKLSEFWLCLGQFLGAWEEMHLPYEPTIGLMQYRTRVPWKRKDVFEDVATLGCEVHLLGLPDMQDFRQELPYARRLGFRGIDTSLPFALGYWPCEKLGISSEKLPLLPHETYTAPRDVDAWAEVKGLISENTKTLRRWCWEGKVE